MISLGWETGHEKTELSWWKNYFANGLCRQSYFFWGVLGKLKGGKLFFLDSSGVWVPGGGG